MSELSRQKKGLVQEAQMTGFQGFDATQTTFAEGWAANLATTLHSDMMISEFIMEAPVRERNRKLTDMINDGEIPEEVFRQFWINRKNTVDWDALSQHIRNEGIDDTIELGSEIQAKIKNEIVFYEKKAAELNSRAGFAGKAGAFAGGMHMGMLDPINVAASFLVPAAGPAATILGTMTKQGLTGAAAGLATEVVIQPFVKGYKNQMGMKYTWGDAATNAALSTLMGGTISASAGGLAKAIDNIKVAKIKAREAGEIDAFEALEAMEDIFTQLEVEAKNAPEPDLDPKVFDENVGNRGMEIEDGIDKTVNPEPIVKAEEVDDVVEAMREMVEDIKKQEEQIETKAGEEPKVKGEEPDVEAEVFVEDLPEHYTIVDEEFGDTLMDAINDWDDLNKSIDAVIDCMKG